MTSRKMTDGYDEIVVNPSTKILIDRNKFAGQSVVSASQITKSLTAYTEDITKRNALRIIQELYPAYQEEIVLALNMPKTSVMRLLESLMTEGHILTIGYEHEDVVTKAEFLKVSRKGSYASKFFCINTDSQIMRSLDGKTIPIHEFYLDDTKIDAEIMARVKQRKKYNERQHRLSVLEKLEHYSLINKYLHEVILKDEMEINISGHSRTELIKKWYKEAHKHYFGTKGKRLTKDDVKEAKQHLPFRYDDTLCYITNQNLTSLSSKN